MSQGSILKTEKYKLLRLEQNNILKQWRNDSKTKELFDNNTLTPTNNNGLYALIKEQMESGNQELIQNIRQNLTSGTTGYLEENGEKKQKRIYGINQISNFLKEMGFNKTSFMENTKNSHINVGKGKKVDKINNWLNEKSNKEYINTIQEDKYYYPPEALNIIKEIYDVVENGNELNQEQLSKVLEKHFGINLNEFKELNLYSKYSFNSKIEKNINDTKDLNFDELTSLDLIKTMTKSDDIISSESNIELFVSKVLNMELAEIKGWLITAIKYDFEEIKQIIQESNDTKEIKENIFTFINSRSFTIEKDGVSEPFKFNEDGNVDFNIAKRGMPDVIYFPKNENVKPITSLNITTDPNKRNTILMHSFKASVIGNEIISKIKTNYSIDEILYDYKNSTILDKDLSKILSINNKKDIVEFLLKNKDNVDVDKIFSNFDFSVILNDSTLSVYNQSKISIEQRKVLPIEYLDKFEKYNVLIYAFSQVAMEDKQIDGFQITNEDKKDLKNFLNQLISNVDISILSNEGNLTTIQKQNIDSYGKKLADFFTNKSDFNEFLNLNTKNNNNTFGEEFHKAINKSFNYLINDTNSVRELIKNLANGTTIDFESFIKLDEISSLSKLKDDIQKVISTNTKNTKEIQIKVNNLKDFINVIDDFQKSFIERDIKPELIDIL